LNLSASQSPSTSELEVPITRSLFWTNSINFNRLPIWHIDCEAGISHVDNCRDHKESQTFQGLAGEFGMEHVEVLTREGKVTTGLTTLRGLILPVEWDERGTISSIAVSTNSEEEYLVDENPLADELLAFVRLRAKVRGFVREDENGKKIITVENYEVLED
jgi:hypothetical protein